MLYIIRDFIAESLDTAPLNPGTYWTTRVTDGSER